VNLVSRRSKDGKDESDGQAATILGSVPGTVVGPRRDDDD